MGCHLVIINIKNSLYALWYNSSHTSFTLLPGLVLVVVLVVDDVDDVVLVEVVVVVVVDGGGASEFPAVGDGADGAGSDSPGGEGVGGTSGPTSSTSQLQSQPHSTGNCSPAWPRALVRSDTEPFTRSAGFGLLFFFFFFRLLPTIGGWPSAISVRAPISPDTIAITYSAGILQPQLQPHPISADLGPLGMVVVTVSTVTCPVTATVVVVGGAVVGEAVVVCSLHSLQ